MSKRGRPPLPPERRRSVPITIWVRPEVAEGMYRMMGRNHRTLSTWAAGQFERILCRERELIATQISSAPTAR